MHGPSCPRVYAPFAPTQDATPTERALREAVRSLIDALDYVPGSALGGKIALVHAALADAERAARAPEGGEDIRPVVAEALDELERRVADKSLPGYHPQSAAAFMGGYLAGERAARAEPGLRELVEAARGVLSYPGPINMTEESHAACLPDECYVTALRAALEAHGEPPREPDFCPHCGGQYSDLTGHIAHAHGEPRHVCGCHHQGPCRESNCGHHEWQDAQRLSAQGEPQEGKR